MKTRRDKVSGASVWMCFRGEEHATRIPHMESFSCRLSSAKEKPTSTKMHSKTLFRQERLTRLVSAKESSNASSIHRKEVLWEVSCKREKNWENYTSCCLLQDSQKNDTNWKTHPRLCKVWDALRVLPSEDPLSVVQTKRFKSTWKNRYSNHLLICDNEFRTELRSYGLEHIT